MPRPTLTTEEVRTRQDEILNVAQRLFEDEGLEAVSTRRIAAAIGCSRATPYRYFPGIDDVLHGLRIRAYQAIRVELESAASAEPEIADKPAAIARAYIGFALEHPDTYELMFRVGETPEDEPILARAKHEALDVCTRALAESEAHGHIRLRTDAFTAAHLFWAAAHGAASLHLSGQLIVGRSLEQVATMLTSTLMTGLSTTEVQS